jgi:hypothetical protein
VISRIKSLPRPIIIHFIQAIGAKPVSDPSLSPFATPNSMSPRQPPLASGEAEKKRDSYRPLVASGADVGGDQ